MLMLLLMLILMVLLLLLLMLTPQFDSEIGEIFQGTVLTDHYYSAEDQLAPSFA
jgi:hypothetical protein